MTVISQRIPNFIGGVSQQADEKMLLGQVKDAVNCYPDITLGMLKRPGGKFIGKLASMTANTADPTAWFSMFRDNQEKYIANITSPGVNTVTTSGTAKTVYTGLSGTVTGGSGSNATFNVTVSGTSYSVSVATGGTGYAGTTQTVTILGTDLGGTSPTNDLSFTVTVTSGVISNPTTITGTAKTIYTGIVLGDDEATVTISKSGTTYTATAVTAAGYNYKAGDVFTISGSVLGGVAGANNLTVTVATVTPAGSLKVWDMLTGLAGTITYPAGKQASIESYLTATDYRSIKTLTINDFTYIVNSEKVVTVKAPTTFNPLRQAVISLLIVEHDTNYTVTINRTNYTYTSPSNTGGTNLTVETVMKGIMDAIGFPSGLGLTKTIVDGVLVLTSTVDMAVSVAGGNASTDGHYIRVFSNEVSSISRLPDQCTNNLVVKVVNSSGAADDYYVKFIGTTNGIAGTYSQTGTTVTVTTASNHGFSTGNLANVVFSTGNAVKGTYQITVTSATQFTYTSGTSQTTSGNVSVSSAYNQGYWEETIAPGVSTGLNEATMPVALLRTSINPLTFRATFLDGSEVVNNLPLQWEPRLVGDDDTNSHPTFVDHTIQDIFLFNNRLGFLTEDNVSMSQAGDYYNFYHKSATTLTAADPIDLSCASIKPAIIRSVVPTAQGLLLFSDGQQFMMEAENGAWTPANCSISTIANYECDRYIKPIDMGSTTMYVSRNQSWSRVFEIFTRGQRETPSVSETTKVVPEWMPSNITDTVGSAQNGLWMASGRTSPVMYLYRFYEQGNERPMAAWAKWSLPNNIIHTAIQNDTLYVLTSGTEGYTLTQHKLVLAPSTGGLLNIFGNAVDPYLDSWCEVTDATITSPAPPTAPTYNQVDDTTKVYLPTYFNTSKTIRYVVGLKKVPPVGTESGYTNVAVLETDGGGTYFNIPGDASGSYIYVGYEYQMEVTLPRYYYRRGEAGVDFTAVTTTSRMSFYTGLGGDIYFSLRDRTRTEWFNVNGAKIADLYTANTSPFRDSFIYKVPIYQRPDNYTMKVTSNTPFPVSLVSMQWEGQYSPGFYRRT